MLYKFFLKPSLQNERKERKREGSKREKERKGVKSKEKEKGAINPASKRRETIWVSAPPEGSGLSH